MLDRLRAITEKRTPGDWTSDEYDVRVDEFVVASDLWPADAAAIVAMDHTYEALLAGYQSMVEVTEHAIGNLRRAGREQSARYIEGELAKVRAALDARIAEVTK